MFLTFFAALYVLLFASCADSEHFSGISTEVYSVDQLYNPNMDATSLRVCVEVDNREESFQVTECSVVLRFYNNENALLHTETRTVTSYIEPGSVHYEEMVFNDSGNVLSNVADVYAVPYSVTVIEAEEDEEEGCQGFSIGWTVAGIIGLCFVGGVLWGLFFD